MVPAAVLLRMMMVTEEVEAAEAGGQCTTPSSSDLPESLV
jgi:hypothetical protein